VKKILLVFLFGVSGVLGAMGQVTWQKSYVTYTLHHNYTDVVQQTTDSGYIIATSIGDTEKDLLLIRIDPNGDTIWKRSYGNTGNDYSRCVLQSNDGGFIVAYSSSNYGNILIKIDSVGYLLWSKSYSGYTTSLRQTNDEGYIITGGINNNVSATRIDSLGNIIWTKTYGGSSTDQGNSIKQISNGGYIITGQTQSFGVSGSLLDIYLLEIDSSGNLQWSKTYGKPSRNCRGSDVYQNIDGGYIVLGYYSGGFGNNPNDMFLIKTDSLGDTLWTKSYDLLDYDVALSIQLTTDGGYSLGGYAYSSSVPSSPFLIKTNDLGDTLWTRKFGPPVEAIATSLQPTFNGGFIMAGSVGSLRYNLYLIKTDSLGNSNCLQKSSTLTIGFPAFQITSPSTVVISQNDTSTSVNVIGNNHIISVTDCSVIGINENVRISNKILIYPNPTSGSFTIETQLYSGILEVYNMLGERVHYLPLALSSWIGEKGEVRTNISVQPGIYFVRVSDGERSFTEKLVVQ
jgi:hypothetical protein